MVATGETVGLAEWIIDDTCLVYNIFKLLQVMLNQIAELLVKQKVRYIRIDGNTSSELRNAHCAQFQSDDKTKVALLSSKIYIFT